MINFWGFARIRCFTKCTIIVMKSIAKTTYIATYVLFRMTALVKFINSKICVAIYNSLTNIVLIPVSVIKLTCLLNILSILAFRFFVFVSYFCSYQIVLKGASFTPTNHRRLLPNNSFVFLIRRKKYLCLI